MKKNYLIIAAVIAIMAIVGVGIFSLTRDENLMSSKDVKSSTTQQTIISVDKNSAVYKKYSNLKGEDYDRMFIANMIAYHQGAIDMANLALTNAKHQEIKDLASNIIKTQTKEITDLESWQKAWGYPISNGMMMEDHSAMGMMVDMADMSNMLKALTSDEFDKAFLSLMIEHHQSAINMADPGRLNALHDEVKALANAIIDIQGKEIAQMKQWQKDWNY